MSESDCKIAFDGEYYISHGPIRYTKTWRTLRGAQAAAKTKGLNVTNMDSDPAEEYRANQGKTKIVTSLMTGKLVRIGVNTPLSCDPSSETYWSM